MANTGDLVVVLGVDPDELDTTPRWCYTSNMENLGVQFDVDPGTFGVDLVGSSWRSPRSHVSGLSRDSSFEYVTRVRVGHFGKTR